MEGKLHQVFVMFLQTSPIKTFLLTELKHELGQAWQPWSLRRGWVAESPPSAPRWTRDQGAASWGQSCRWDHQTVDKLHGLGSLSTELATHHHFAALSSAL